MLTQNKVMCYNILCQQDIFNIICGCGGTGRRAGLRNQYQRCGGSSPLIRTNDVSVRTNKTDRYKNQSENKSG